MLKEQVEMAIQQAKWGSTSLAEHYLWTMQERISAVRQGMSLPGDLSATELEGAAKHMRAAVEAWRTCNGSFLGSTARDI